MLKLVLPKGSLEKATLELFEAADLGVSRSSTVDYRATIDDPRIDEVRILRPQEIPQYVAEGVFDLGITGRDWIEETASEVDVARRAALLEGDRPAREDRRGRARRLARSRRSTTCPRACGSRTEYPELTRRFFEKRGIERRHPPVLRRHRGQGARHRRLHRRHHRDRAGAAGGRPPDHRHDPHVLHRADRQPAERYADQDKQHAMHQIRTLLAGHPRGPGQGAGEAQRVGAPTSTR